MKHAKPSEKLALKLTAAERTVLRAIQLPPAFEQLIESTPPSEPLMLPAGSVEALGVYVGAVANHTPDTKARNKIKAISEKMLHVLSDARSATKALSQTPKKTSSKKPSSKAAKCLYQFKIALAEIEPPIWRRIQVSDCTLDKLHEHIQTSMGWTNSHLHRFQIGEKRYADPMLMEEDMDEYGYIDSTTTMLSEIVPKSGKRLALVYEYDFGDGWEHEVVFEGCPQTEPGRKYPLCLEGKRACPPEDVGSSGGYERFLAIIADPSHEEHKDTLRWAGGWFDPEKFDPAAATKAMNKGLPDWRNEEWV